MKWLDPTAGRTDTITNPVQDHLGDSRCPTTATSYSLPACTPIVILSVALGRRTCIRVAPAVDRTTSLVTDPAGKLGDDRLPTRGIGSPPEAVFGDICRRGGWRKRIQSSDRKRRS